MYMRTTIAIESATFVGPAKHSVLYVNLSTQRLTNFVVL